MGLLSRTPNGELETEAMIAEVPSGLSEKNGAGGGGGDGEVRECVDVTAKHTRPTGLGGRAAGRVGSRGIHRDQTGVA